MSLNGALSAYNVLAVSYVNSSSWLHLKELLLFPTAGWHYGIDMCQSGGP